MYTTICLKSNKCVASSLLNSKEKNALTSKSDVYKWECESMINLL